MTTLTSLWILLGVSFCTVVALELVHGIRAERKN
jgi:hypothetical protein